MPIFSYECNKCGSSYERLENYAERDRAMVCEGACGGALHREGLELCTVGKPSFQTYAVKYDGSKVAGHFGKTARNKKGWYRP